MSATTPQPQPGLSDRLGSIIAGLRRHLADSAGRDRALAPLVLILWNRLGAIAVRFAALLARHRAGRLRTLRKPRERRAPPVPPPPDTLPRRRGWLLRRVPLCGVYGGYLGRLLDDPQMVALLAELPEARRLLRPLWRMLRTEPPPPVLQTPRAPSPPPDRPRSRPPGPHRRSRSPAPVAAPTPTIRRLVKPA